MGFKLTHYPTVRPDPARTRTYDAAYEKYRALYPALVPHFHGTHAA